MQTHSVDGPPQFDKCNKTGRAPSHPKQHQLTYQTASTDNTEPQLSEPRQWVVINGQCLPIKQDLEENANRMIVKQEKGQCLPIKQELEENPIKVIVKQEKGQCLPIKQELEENPVKVIVKQESLDV